MGDAIVRLRPWLIGLIVLTFAALAILVLLGLIHVMSDFGQIAKHHHPMD